MSSFTAFFKSSEFDGIETPISVWGFKDWGSPSSDEDPSIGNHYEFNFEVMPHTKEKLQYLLLLETVSTKYPDGIDCEVTEEEYQLYLSELSDIEESTVIDIYEEGNIVS